MLEFKTAGESHGRGLLVIVDGLPAGIEIDFKHIKEKMARRQGGYGRGGRMKLEEDQVEIFSGVRHGRTMGSPVGLLIFNRDWQNWQQVMSPLEEETGAGQENSRAVIRGDKKLKFVAGRVTRPRPGHADFAGAVKYNLTDMRDVIERSSARETAARTAAGALIESFLNYFDIEVISHLIQLGKVKADIPDIPLEELKKRVYTSPLHCYDREKEEEMISYIDRMKNEGDSLGGVVQLRTTPLPPGLGSHTHWDKRLDSRLAAALMSIPAIKGVEIGPAFQNAALPGSEVHDQLYYQEEQDQEEQGFYRLTNRAGGLEGGISNGQPLLINLAMKPLPTLYRPLNSVDLASKKSYQASIERSDVTAVTAAGVVGEAMVSYVLAGALLDKFGGDHIEETVSNYQRFRETSKYL